MASATNAGPPEERTCPGSPRSSMSLPRVRTASAEVRLRPTSSAGHPERVLVHDRHELPRCVRLRSGPGEKVVAPRSTYGAWFG